MLSNRQIGKASGAGARPASKLAGLRRSLPRRRVCAVASIEPQVTDLTGKKVAIIGE